MGISAEFTLWPRAAMACNVRSEMITSEPKSHIRTSMACKHCKNRRLAQLWSLGAFFVRHLFSSEPRTALWNHRFWSSTLCVFCHCRMQSRSTSWPLKSGMTCWFGHPMVFRDYSVKKRTLCFNGKNLWKSLEISGKLEKWCLASIKPHFLIPEKSLKISGNLWGRNENFIPGGFLGPISTTTPAISPARTISKCL